ncbi:MAG: ribosomal protein S18-alanine N-acetyltransferase [Tissierellales bacterium]
MSDVIIREMTEEDIDDVLEVEKESFATPWTKEAFVLELIKNQLARYIVAEKDEKIVGYGGLWLILDEGHITNIAVSSNHRGQGIGNLLVERLIGICEERGINNMTLEVRKTNFIAQYLYKKYDFVDCGVRKGYYTDTKEDAVIMWRVK